ncbi:hypothetical protein [Croceicoccus gelatinilyticus]|uniref:hypothetical protein n=1 Tax=Croceicoccus gelatinilyticus TaxID=2835536 RepID=UPI001BD05E96|nr:hypothetical protein [Croceicoccus gelatinilyticus]MBS7669952.1 hypothetical protein [Croceicoccus gelatinilyticus]
MHIDKAYERRTDLTTSELERLLSALENEVARYRDTIRNYPPDRMQKYGKPFLDSLQQRVTVVAELLSTRSDEPS